MSSKSITRIAIIGAMQEEIEHIAASLEHAHYEDGASLHVACGTLTTDSGRQLQVSATVGGMGLVNAAATTQYLCDTYQPDAIIFSGIAGNLNSKLHVNDIVLGKTLRYLDTDMRLINQWKPFTDEYHSDELLLNIADRVLTKRGITHVSGTIASGNYFVDSPEKSAEVVRLTNADAVEMEGAAVAHVAARNDVPALIIRAMSDNADTEYETFHTFDISQYADRAANITLNIVHAL